MSEPACQCECGEPVGYYKLDGPGHRAGDPHRFAIGHSHRWPKVVLEHHIKYGEPDECWPWMGRTCPEGYGKLGPYGRAHRMAYEKAHGPIPAGMCVMHSCDNPPCCNPAHLSLGTQTDNMRDRDAKGRNRNVGGPRKLDLETAREMRARYAAGGVTHPQLAAEYGIHRAHAVRVVNNRVWPEREAA